MISIRIKAWVPIDGLTHIATTWQIATNKECTNIIHMERSETDLNMKMFDIDAPLGTTYYGRAMRHFDDSNADYWSEAKPITNRIANYGLLLIDDIFIETPSVYCNQADVQDDNLTFTVSTSKCRGNDGHVSTHWIITDAVDNVLFVKLYDNVNKTSIDIEKNSNITSTTQLKVKAIHVSSGGIESHAGETIVDLNHFNFEVTSNLLQVKPHTYLNLTLTPIDNTLPIGLRRVDVKTADNELLWYKLLTDSDYSITIPWYVLTANSEFIMTLTAVNKSGKLSSMKTKIATQSSKVKEVINPDYVYLKKITKDVNILADAVLPTGITTHELGNSSIILPLKNKTDASKATYSYVNLDYNVTVDKVNGLSLLNGSNENTYIRLLENNLLLVDTLTNTGFPMFLVYSHTPKDDTYTLINALVREDETFSMGKNNAIIQINANELLYNPYGTNKLKKYNTVTNTVINVTDIPMANFVNGILLRMSGDRVLVIGGTDFTMKIYSIADNEFSDGISTMPGSFINRNLKTTRLINGDYLIFKVAHKAGDTESSMLYFDTKELKFEELPIVFNSDEFPTSVVTLLNGDVLLLNYSEINGVATSKQLLFS